MSSQRKAEVRRTTQETDIQLRLNIDGSGKASVKTGIPFLEHMLASLAKHGLFDLQIKARGDLEVDIHHTNEDVGLVVGQAAGTTFAISRSRLRMTTVSPAAARRMSSLARSRNSPTFTRFTDSS